jgi:large subunit ribosomal protein L30
MLAAVRLRGNMNVNKEVRDTMNMLGLKRVNTLVVLPESPVTLGMLKKVENFITYGKISEVDAKQFSKVMRLKPPRGGLKSIKKSYPRGDLGYRGEAIKDFIRAMI